MTATAAKTSASDPYEDTVLANPDAAAVDAYGISKRDITQIYVSSHPYCKAFEEELNLRRFHCYNKPTAGMIFNTENSRLILAEMEKSSPGHQIPRWRSRLRGAWLRQVGDTIVQTREDVKRALATLCAQNAPSCILVFSHPAIRHGLTNTGIPQVNIDQLNPCLMFRHFRKDIS